MFGDNSNFRSVSNMPIQGMGGVVLRRAIKYSQDKGLNVIVPLHDALYIETNVDKLESDCDLLAQCMKDAFIDAMNCNGADLIQLDCEAWGQGLVELYDKEMITKLENKIKIENIHIDQRGLNEYKTYSKYFNLQTP
jgi:hypothetical protein